MARLPRLSLANYPHHIIQRGHNRQLVFAGVEDFETMLALLHQNAGKFKVAIHAYVLMDNHLHLLATPQTAEGLPQMMQAVGRSYVRYFNDKHQRTGTLWDGRYRSTVIQAERYLLACMAYMDLNPVRAGVVESASHYAWSSHGHYVGLRTDKVVSAHALFWQLGNTPFAREAAYAELVQAGIHPDQKQALTDSALSGWALGDRNFVDNLQKLTPRRIVKSAAGRPLAIQQNPLK